MLHSSTMGYDMRTSQPISAPMTLGKRYDKLAGKIFFFTDIFNVSFFFVSLFIWLFITFTSGFTEITGTNLWAAFNGMYGHLEFKVACIVFIFFNGLVAMKTMYDQIFLMFIQVNKFRVIGKIRDKRKARAEEQRD